MDKDIPLIVPFLIICSRLTIILVVGIQNAGISGIKWKNETKFIKKKNTRKGIIHNKMKISFLMRIEKMNPAVPSVKKTGSILKIISKGTK